MNNLKFILMSFVVLAFLPIKAAQIMGADITYKAIDNLKYEITFNLYRDCRTASLGNPSSSTKIWCSNGGTSDTLFLTLKSIKEITALCASTNSQCSPANTNNTGFGLEKHTYVDTIDLSSGRYSSFASCSGSIIIDIRLSQRDSNINTGAAGAYFYTYAEIKLDKSVPNYTKNSSPVFTNDPILINYCYQPSRYSLGDADTLDNDSFSYQWAHPLSAWNTTIGYTGTNYAYNHPFQVYYPSSSSPPYSNPNSSPPIGIYLNTETGESIYTPTRCDEVTVSVLEVKEWRKDTSGNYKHIGTTRRDIESIGDAHSTFNDNNPPIISGP
jgi:hypothetical protein